MKNIKVTLLYPPNQAWPGTMCKPNGSLAYPYLAGALKEKNIEVNIFDACVGNEKDSLDEIFYKSTGLPGGLLRTGVSDERILEEISNSDIVGLTSIFTDQETMVLRTAGLIKKHYPDKFILSGGVNARSRNSRFLEHGIDAVCLGEAEQTICEITSRLQKSNRDLNNIPGLAFKTPDGRININPAGPENIIKDLDKLPIPAWDLLPNNRYWKIRRPHGGYFPEGSDLRYASMMTSRGCVFSCRFCHIAGETKDNISGAIGRFRVKSDERVLREIEVLKNIRVKQVFIEDDSFLAKRKRAIRLLDKIRMDGLEIIDVNGINPIHLFKNSEPDEELLEALKNTGFTEIVLPFEPGCQRVINKYASSKWNVEKLEVPPLIQLCKKKGLRVAGNYMIGFPDETREEIEQTINTAKHHRSHGLDSANFFCVIPLPGTPLFQYALEQGQIKEEKYNPDRMTWLKGNIINSEVGPEELEDIRLKAWEETNDDSFVDYKTDMQVSE